MWVSSLGVGDIMYQYRVYFPSHLKTLHPVMQAETEKMWTGISQEYLRY